LNWTGARRSDLPSRGRAPMFVGGRRGRSVPMRRPPVKARSLGVTEGVQVRCTVLISVELVYSTGRITTKIGSKAGAGTAFFSQLANDDPVSTPGSPTKRVSCRIV